MESHRWTVERTYDDFVQLHKMVRGQGREGVERNRELKVEVEREREDGDCIKCGSPPCYLGQGVCTPATPKDN